MPAGNLTVEVVTPEGVVLSTPARSVRLPGADGSFGVLAGHAPLIAALETGLLIITPANGSTVTWAVGEGFAEVAANEVRVLCDFADESGSIDVARARAAKERAQTRLKTREENVDRVRAEAALQRALLRLKAASNP